MYIYIYKPNKCNENVTGMVWISRALDAVIGRAKTRIKGKFLFAVDSSPKRVKLRVATANKNLSLIYIYIYIFHNVLGYVYTTSNFPGFVDNPETFYSDSKWSFALNSQTYQ